MNLQKIFAFWVLSGFATLSLANTKTKIDCKDELGVVSYEYSAIDSGYDLSLHAVWTIEGLTYLEQSDDLSEELTVLSFFSPIDQETSSGDIEYYTNVKVMSYFGQVLFEGSVLCRNSTDSAASSS